MTERTTTKARQREVRRIQHVLRHIALMDDADKRFLKGRLWAVEFAEV